MSKENFIFLLNLFIIEAYFFLSLPFCFGCRRIIRWLFFKKPNLSKFLISISKLIRSSVSNEVSYGDAAISKKHANFFVNKKNAKSADMKSLISFVKKKVKDQTGVKLELEIVVVE